MYFLLSIMGQYFFCLMLLCCYLEIKFICAHIGIILMIKTGLKIVFLYRAMIVVWFWWHFILSFAVFFFRISSCITPQLRAKFIRQLTMIACAAKFFFVLLYTCFIFLAAKFENLRSIQLKFMKRESRVVFLRGGERGEKTILFDHNATLFWKLKFSKTTKTVSSSQIVTLLLFRLGPLFLKGRKEKPMEI